MNSTKRRLDDLESGVTPKQAMLLWLQEAYGFNGIEEYVRHLKTQPDNAAPLYKLPSLVEEGVRRTLKGKPKEEIDLAINQAHKDILFLFFLHQRVNEKLITEDRYYRSQAMLLTSKLGSLLREQSLLNQIRRCLEAEEANKDMSQRESLSDDLQVGRTSGTENRFRQRGERWKELALGFLPEIYTLRRTIDSIDERYLVGQGILFSPDTQRFNEPLALAEKTVHIFNESLAVAIPRWERLLVESEDGQETSPLAIDWAGLIENVRRGIRMGTLNQSAC